MPENFQAAISEFATGILTQVQVLELRHAGELQDAALSIEARAGLGNLCCQAARRGRMSSMETMPTNRLSRSTTCRRRTSS